MCINTFLSTIPPLGDGWAKKLVYLTFVIEKVLFLWLKDAEESFFLGKIWEKRDAFPPHINIKFSIERVINK